MMVLPPACAAIGAVLPFTPLAGPLGFATLPLAFFLILLGMIVSYLALVEVAKARFYAVPHRPIRARLTHSERHARHVRRRARRFTFALHGSSHGRARRRVAERPA